MNKNEDLEKSNFQECPGSGVSHVEQVSWTKKANESRVVLTNISAAWTKDQRCVLHQVSLTVSSSQLLMVTGSVGSGKSSLLMAILEEIHITKGEMDTQGRIAYVSQIPWIFSGTVRDNIVFGQSFDETRYNRILEICDLHKDIICFPNGDLSIIGQRGVGLSGGQRARVSLARAVYTDVDIFLMDDPLSAVDARVGQHIFDKCICGELSSRIRIVVTHQVQHLPRADKIAVVQEGIIIQGTYSELKDKGIFFKIQENQKTAKSIYNKEITNSDKLANRDMREDEEDRATGIVSWRLYWEFFTVGSPAVLIGCFGLFYAVVQGKHKK
jgi:ABC-type multidrug transport system fused ATPase/permease subunit